MLLKVASRVADPTAAVQHLLGMHTFIRSLQSGSSPVPEWEWEWIEGLWIDSLVELTWQTRRLAFQDSQLLGQQLGKICDALRAHDLQILQVTPSLRALVMQLQIYLCYSFNNFLVLINDDHTTVAVTCVSEAVVRLVRQLIEALHHCDDGMGEIINRLDGSGLGNVGSSLSGFSVRDLEYPSIYCTSRLVERLVACRDAERLDATLVSLAISRLRISVLLVSILRGQNALPWKLRGGIIRNLFLVGLVLTKSSHPEGDLPFAADNKLENAWIRHELDSYHLDFAKVTCNGVLFGSETDCALRLLTQFLEKADECVSWKEVWTMEVENIGLWQGVAFLVGIHGTA
jgi:hypothetical protein